MHQDVAQLPYDDNSTNVAATTPRWHTELGDWQVWLEAADRPATTVGLRRYQLRRFAEAHRGSPYRVTTEHMMRWLRDNREAKGWATEYLRSYRAALRSFYGWAHAAGRNDHDPAKLLPAIKPANHLPRPAPERVVRAAIQTTVDPKVRLMVVLAARQGLRRGEIARVSREDLVEDLAGYSLRVLGKGRKERLVPLHDEVAAVIQAYPPGCLFPSPTGTHLTPPYVGKLIRRQLEGPWTTHTLRHRFGTVIYLDTGDILSVQMVMGHSKPETTQRYVQVPAERLRRTIRAA